MDKSYSNECITCTVTECANHSSNSNNCALQHITIGTHETNPTVDQCTDCKSFIVKS